MLCYAVLLLTVLLPLHCVCLSSICSVTVSLKLFWCLQLMSRHFLLLIVSLKLFLLKTYHLKLCVCVCTMYI